MASVVDSGSPLPAGLPVAACYVRLKREIQALVRENEELKKLVELMRQNQDLRTVLQNLSVDPDTLIPLLTSTPRTQRPPGNVFGPGPTADPQAFQKTSSLTWEDTLEEGMITQGVRSEGQIFEARGRIPEASHRSGADTSKKYTHNLTDPQSAYSPFGITGSNTVFFPDTPLVTPPSPAGRATPISFHLPSSTPAPTTPPPADVRPKRIYRATDKALTQGAASRTSVAEDPQSAYSPFGITGSNTVFFPDTPLVTPPSPAGRATPISFHLPSSTPAPTTLPPADVRPKRIYRATDKALTQGAASRTSVAEGPTADPQAFQKTSSLTWEDTLEEGMITQGVRLEGQIFEARGRIPEASHRSGADTSKKYTHNLTDPQSAYSPFGTTGSNTVFFPDTPLVTPPSPAGRATPISFHLPSSTPAPTTPPPVDTQRPPDVRPKRIFRTSDKALTQGAASRSTTAKDHRQQTWERIVGEIAFQLDRRILSIVFPERMRLYGFTVSNIPEKIIKVSTNPLTNQMDDEQCTEMTRRYLEIMNHLSAVGYNARMHPSVTEHIVNTYGILRDRPELTASESSSYNNIDFLRKVVAETVPESIRKDTLMLLECLSQLSKEDGKPMFIW